MGCNGNTNLAQCAHGLDSPPPIVTNPVWEDRLCLAAFSPWNPSLCSWSRGCFHMLMACAAWHCVGCFVRENNACFPASVISHGMIILFMLHCEGMGMLAKGIKGPLWQEQSTRGKDTRRQAPKIFLDKISSS